MKELLTKELLFYLFFTEGDSKLQNDRNELIQSFSLTDGDVDFVKMSIIKAHSLIWKLEKENQEAETFNKDVQNTLEMLYHEIGFRKNEIKSLSFSQWIENWWKEEQIYRNAEMEKYSTKATKPIFATYFSAKYENSVAVPDQYAKFANYSVYLDSNYRNNIPANYRNWYAYPPYKVTVTYSGVTKSDIPVMDVGPWNLNDNYWDAVDGGCQRREYRDLARYVPEAYAAFYNNYNDGKDYRGRTITNPAGIDLSTDLASALGLKNIGLAQVYVDFAKMS